MDIKKEPDDELLSSNGTPRIDNDVEMNVSILSEGHSLGSGFGVRVKQEFDKDDYNNEENVVIMESQNIKKENEDSWEKYKQVYNDDVRFIKEEKIDVGECSYAERKPEKFQSPITYFPAQCEPNSTNASQNSSVLTKSTIEKCIKTEILQCKVVAVISLENGIFHKRNFVCSHCFDIFPSSRLLDKHVMLHGKSKFNEKSQNLKMEIKIEPKDESILSENSNDSDSHHYYMNDILIEGHSIDIEFEVPEVKNRKIINHENHRPSRKTYSTLHSNGKTFKCDKCSYKSARSHSFKIHQMSHTGEKPFKCDQCNYKSVTSYQLKIHKMSHSGEKPFKCDQCIYKTMTFDSLKKHKMTHTGEKPFKCDQCNFRAGRSNEVKLHKMSHTGKKPFKCDKCSFETIRFKNFKVHKMLHADNKPFKCDQCSFETVTSYYLKKHKKTHTDEKSFKCEKCSFKTIRSCDLKLHDMSHTGEKPFKCDRCNFKTARSFNLKKHKMTHIEVKHLKCDKCIYETAHARALKEHIMTHTGEKPFECDKCSFKSIRAYNLRLHQLSHTGEKSLKCD